MTQVLLEAMFGSEVFQDATAKVALFATPARGSAFKETHIAIAAKKADYPVTKLNQSGPHSAWSAGAAAELGQWTIANFNMEEGSFVKIFVKRHRGFGSRVRQAAQYIRMREGAAYREITIQLTGNAKARYNTATIKGRFDIIDLKEADARGIETGIHFRRFFDRAEVAHVMEMKILEPETNSVPVVRERLKRDKNGDVIVVQEVRKKRVLDLD